MMRRLGSCVARSAAAARCYTPPEDMKKLYNSDYDSQAFPINIIGADSNIFAKFLYKAAEGNKSFDVVLKDFQTIATAKLPVFWERAASIDQIAEFKGLSPATIFTLHWMQQNSMLDQLSSVRSCFESYVNAQRKKAVAKVFIKDAADTASVNEGKKIAAEMHKDNKEISAFALEFEVLVDSTITSGFCVELAGSYVNQAKGIPAAGSINSAVDIDFTNIPNAKSIKTTWDDSIETEILRKYIEQLAQFDAEEAKNGV